MATLDQLSTELTNLGNTFEQQYQNIADKYNVLASDVTNVGAQVNQVSTDVGAAQQQTLQTAATATSAASTQNKTLIYAAVGIGVLFLLFRK